MKMTMRFLFLLLFSTVQLQIFAQNIPQLEQKLATSHDSVFCQIAFQISDAYFKAEKFDEAAGAAVKAYQKASELGRKDLMAIALNKEAKATVKNRKAKKMERLAALAKFGESLELVTSSKIDNAELEMDNIENLRQAGENMAQIIEKSEVRKILHVCLDSVKKELIAIPGAVVNMDSRPPSPPAPPGSPEEMKRHDRQREYQQKIMAMNLAHIEKELRNAKVTTASGNPEMPELVALSVLPNLKEKWGPKKAEIEREFAREIRKIEQMNADEAREELLLAEYKYKYDSLAHLHILDSINLEKTEIALQKQASEMERQQARKSLMMVGSGSTLVLSFLLFFGFLNQKKTNRLLSQKNEKIQQEQDRSEELLLNILPSEVANELKQYGAAKAHRYDEVTVLFSDFKDFTGIAEELSPEMLISDLDHCFKAFDRITEKYRLEKIKTIGDAYLCAGGLPSPDPEHAIRTVQAALEMQDFLKKWKAEKEAKGEKYFEARIGIHTGPIIAGVVGVKKFAYDIWGDTVNIASRMESSGEAGRINISGSTYDLVKQRFNCSHRGKISAKNKGEIDMYFVERTNEA
jgi:class 3 adenylate cyclase